MANYHFSAKVISRANGSHACASLAYRTAERVYDEREQCFYDYRAREHSVEYSQTLVPENAPERFRDAHVLWNEVEAAERRRDAQLAREVEFSLPRELERWEQVELSRDFVQREFVDRGMCATYAIHTDEQERNPHCHVMLTTREVDEDGFHAKNRDWNKRELVEQWRERYAQEQNRALERAYERERTPEHERSYVDHRSYREQDREREPELVREPTEHMGYERAAIERQERERCEELGREYEPVTDMGKRNQERQERNDWRERMQERIQEIKREIERSIERVQERVREMHERMQERQRERQREREYKRERTHERKYEREPERERERTPERVQERTIEQKLEQLRHERGLDRSPYQGLEGARQRLEDSRTIERARESYGYERTPERVTPSEARAAERFIGREEQHRENVRELRETHEQLRENGVRHVPKVNMHDHDAVERELERASRQLDRIEERIYERSIKRDNYGWER